MWDIHMLLKGHDIYIYIIMFVYNIIYITNHVDM